MHDLIQALVTNSWKHSVETLTAFLKSTVPDMANNYWRGEQAHGSKIPISSRQSLYSIVPYEPTRTYVCRAMNIEDQIFIVQEGELHLNYCRHPSRHRLVSDC